MIGAGDLKKIVVDSQFYVSLMGTLLATFFMLEAHTFRFPTFFLIFITYFSGYLYTKYQNTRLFPKILLLNVLAGAVCVVLIIHNHNTDRLLKWFCIVALGLLYNSSFLSAPVRKFPLLKVFYVGLVWGLVNAWLSLPQLRVPFFWTSFLFITALVLPFDIRDMDTDDVVTFPKLIGVRNTKLLALLLLSLAAGVAYGYLRPPFGPAFAVAAGVAAIGVFLAQKNRPDAYYSFWIESCSALPLLFWWLAGR